LADVDVEAREGVAVRDYESESSSESIPTIEVRRVDVVDAVVLAVVGEVDLSNASHLGAIFTHVQRDRPAVLVVDLGEVTFLGSAGLRVLVEACAKAGEGQVRVAAPSAAARRAIEATALDRLLPLFSSVDDALEARTA
jgi:anti-sigma B factor antagonist